MDRLGISSWVQCSSTLLHAVARLVAAKCTAWSMLFCSDASVSLLQAKILELEVQWHFIIILHCLKQCRADFVLSLVYKY